MEVNFVIFEPNQLHNYDFFNLFTSKENNESVENLIKKQVDYLPEIYHNHRQYINCIEYLKNMEWALSLDSLIELAEETGHYFWDEFWASLLEAAKRMKLLNEKEYCLKQQKRNRDDLGYAIPLGWTKAKFNDDVFQISKKIKNGWNTERRKHDTIDVKVKYNGIHVECYDNRVGMIYIVKNGHLAEIEFESKMDATALFIATLKWVLPLEKDMSEDEREEAKKKLLEWGKGNNENIEFS